MLVLCEKCNTYYDDYARWTICPHSPLRYAHDDLCPKCDTLKSIHGPCRHQIEVHSAVQNLMAKINDVLDYCDERVFETVWGIFDFTDFSEVVSVESLKI